MKPTPNTPKLGLVYRFGTQKKRAWQTVPMPVKPSSADESPVVKPTAVTAKDADGDKVPDAKDQCPDTNAGAQVKVDGCPIFGGVVEGINFQRGL